MNGGGSDAVLVLQRIGEFVGLDRFCGTGHRPVVVDPGVGMAPIEQQVEDQQREAEQVMFSGADQGSETLALQFGCGEFRCSHRTGIGPALRP